MRRRSPWLPWLFGIVSIAVLWMLSTMPQSVRDGVQFVIIMIGLVAFVVNVEVPLIGTSISLGYAAGLLVYLSLDSSQSFPALLIVAVGGLLGGLLRAWWRVRDEYGAFLHFDRS